jgi:hypothetical protein
MDGLNKSLSQRERAAEGQVRGTTSKYFFLWYPSPPLRGPSPVGRGIYSVHPFIGFG